MRRVIRFLLWSGVALASALAADGDPSAGAGSIAPVRIGIGPARRSLTLNQAIELAMGNNLDIAIERTNVDSATEAIESARGAFDPVLQWKPGLDNTQTPNTAPGKPSRCMNRRRGAASRSTPASTTTG
jgi:outer membrane protein TolC